MIFVNMGHGIRIWINYLETDSVLFCTYIRTPDWENTQLVGLLLGIFHHASLYLWFLFLIHDNPLQGFD